jgi:transcription elongation GreA/GreB family factor
MDLNGLFAAKGTANTPIPAGVIEFRTKATDKKVASSVRTIEVQMQSLVPNTVVLTGTTLSIQDTDKKRAYEYTLVGKGNTLDLSTARWSSITAARSVIIPKASIGDVVCVRLKSTTDSTTRQVILASTYKPLTVETITIKP